MKLCRFYSPEHDVRNGLGVCDGDGLFDVSSVLETLPQITYPAPRLDRLIDQLDAVCTASARCVDDGARRLNLSNVTLLSPVANPTKLIGAPVNYLKHFDEGMADPEIHHNQHLADIRRIALFLKATSSLVGPGEGIKLRHLDRRNDHELELAVVIGKTADRVSEAEAMSHVAGFTIGLDMTVRGPEDRSFRKSIDSFSVLGPCLVTADEVGDPGALDMSLSVNGELRQRANTRDLVVKIPELIAWASSFYTLNPGDVIFTGTPEGVGPVNPGDVIDAWINKVGSMRVEVSAA